MNDGIYYLRVNGQVDGPFTIGQIYDLWAARKISSQTPFARFEEMDKWQPLSELTLKISAPKTLAPKSAPLEPIPSAPIRPKNPTPLVADEYVPSMVYPREQRAPVHEEARPVKGHALKKLSVDFSVSSGICIVCGAMMTIYCLAFSGASTDGKEIRQDLMILKQNGVMAGVGLVLMGGLLIVAHQMAKILLALKAGASDKGDRKSPRSP